MKDPILDHTTIPPARDGSYPRVPLSFYVEGGLRYLRGNQKPYFTLTYTEHRKGFPNQCQAGGAGHEEILKRFPRFADLAALHPSDIDGVPTHAEENGWYNLAGALPDQAGEQYTRLTGEYHFPKPDDDPRRGHTEYRRPTPDECLTVFLAPHLRISSEEAFRLRDAVLQAAKVKNPLNGNALYDWKAGRAFFDQYIEEQKPRWKQEALACIEKYNLRIFGDSYTPEEAAKFVA